MWLVKNYRNWFWLIEDYPGKKLNFYVLVFYRRILSLLLTERFHMHYLFWSFLFRSLQSRTFYYVSVHWLKMKFKLVTTTHQAQETFTLICFIISSYSTWFLSHTGFSSVLKLIKLFSTLGLCTFSSFCWKDTSSALCIAGSYHFGHK